MTIEESDFIHGLKDRRDAVMTNTPFVRITDSEGNSLIGRVITMDPSSVILHVDVQCPAWTGVDTLEVFINNVYRIPENKNEKFMNPRLTIALDDTYGGLEEGKRWHYSLDIDITDYVDQDSWVVVRVSGHNYTIFPVVFEDVSEDPQDIIDGNVKSGVFPMAITNPVLIDIDGNGSYDPPY